jgi:hypothetical protein
MGLALTQIDRPAQYEQLLIVIEAMNSQAGVEVLPHGGSMARTAKRKQISPAPIASDEADPQSVAPAHRAKPSSSAHPKPFSIDAAQREAMIRNAAYLRAQRRGFGPGQEVEDWLVAEAEVDHSLAIS